MFFLSERSDCVMIKKKMKEFDIHQGFEAIDDEGIKKMRFLVTFFVHFSSKTSFS